MQKKFIKNFLVIILFLLAIFVVGCKKDDDEKDKPSKDDDIGYVLDDLTVREYVGKNGIVTAANPYAAQVGIDILKNGGNAFDAAVGVAFAIGVAEMDANGLGGGGLMIAYNVNTNKSLFYNFREFASSEVSLDLSTYETKGDRHCLFTAVPTELAGLSQILEDQGTLTLKEVLAPSINLARNGVVCTPELINNINDNSSKVNLNSYLKDTFKRPNGSRLKAGDTIIQADLANTLEAISNNGINYFYEGEFASKLVETVTSNGGKLTLQDLKRALDKNYLEENNIIKGTYKDYSIMTVGSPSTGGTMLVEMLNMLESYTGSISDLGHNSAEYINLISTVMQLAYGDKEKYLADKNFVDIPLQGILNKEYARERLEKYRVGQAYLGTGLNDTEVPYGDPTKYNDKKTLSYCEGESLDHYSTTSFSVVDKDGNMVTFTQTINNFFGCGISVENSGFFLNDEMKDFSYVEGSINVIEPLKQPASYMLPTVILNNGKPYATIGSPGGSRIPSAGLQVILNMIEFGMDIQSAINSPRAYCFTTNESNRGDSSKDIYIENGLNQIKDELTSFSYNVTSYGDQQIHSYFGGVQGIKVESNAYHGGADPRRDGKALGF